MKEEKLTKEPLQILGLKYSILITIEQIKIGCELHSVDEWRKFDDEDIEKMYGTAGRDWWDMNRNIIFELHRMHAKGDNNV